MTRASSSLERSLSDRKDFLRSAWTNSAFTDCTLALSIAPGGSKKPADGPAARYVDCVKFQLAKHSPIFRAQIERWGGAPAAAAEGRCVEAAVESEEELAAMMQLLEAMHVEELPPVERSDPGPHLCRLLRLAHFYDVALVLEAAAAALKDCAARLPLAQCAAALCMLQPLAEGEAGGGGVIGRALAACDMQLMRQLDPLDCVFEDEERGATFDALPLAAAARAVRPRPQGAAPSPETAFLACLRWLDANGGGDEGAADALLSRVDYERVCGSVLLAAARCHNGFRCWPGALPALAGAALVREACAAVGSMSAALLRRQLDLPGAPLAGFAGVGDAQPPSLCLSLEVPLAWLAEQAEALERRTSRLQAQPASQQEIDAVQQQLVAVRCGLPRAYRGYRWTPSLALFMRIKRPDAGFGAFNIGAAPAAAAFAFGAAAPGAQAAAAAPAAGAAAAPAAAAGPAAPAAAAAGAAPAAAAGAAAAAGPAAAGASGGQRRQVRLEDLQLSAALHLEVKALPPLDSAPTAGSGASPAGTPGPLAKVTFATGSSGGGFTAEDGQKAEPLVLGAYGGCAAGAPFGVTRWQPPAPPGGAVCLVGAFETRHQFSFNAAPPPHKLPDLTAHKRGDKLHFQVTVALAK